MSTSLLETCRELKQIYIKGIVRQVGYLLELYWDARSPEYKQSYYQSFIYSSTDALLSCLKKQY